jgi:hypothetical protein
MTVSTHIIIKENTNLALLFLKCCLASLKVAKWCDELIIIDNGCFEPIKEYLRDFQKDYHCPVKLIEDDSKKFCDLRNKALSLTDPNIKYVHWIDADETLIPEEWVPIKNILATHETGQVHTYGVHFMVNPSLTQYTFTKENIFRFHRFLKWGKGVHEKMQNTLPGIHQSDSHYLHFGYCKSQWRVMVRWVHYAVLEHGNVNCYKNENIEEPGKSMKTVPFFRDWRTPNTILQDRIPVCEKYGGPKPVVAMPIFEHENEWEDFITKIDDQSFWIRWQQKMKEVGSWVDTLDWFVDECTKNNWWIA